MAMDGRRSPVGRFLFVLGCVLGCMAGAVRAQRTPPDVSKVEIQTVPVVGGLYVLVGEGGNIGVSVGSDGILLVDSQYAPLHQKIMDAVRKISQQPIRFLMNTHSHLDHTGGNELMAKAGAVIVAHENARKRLSAGRLSNNPAQAIPPAPQEALPVVTYSDSMTLHFNGEEIYVYHPEPAHTDGDSVVYFRRANVIQVGDLPSSLRYLRIGVNDGGSLNGMIAAAGQILKIANQDTKIISGHGGPVVSVKEVQQEHDALVVIRDRILGGIRTGKTLEQIIASKPTAEFDESHKGGMTPDDFVRLVYQDLSKNAP